VFVIASTSRGNLLITMFQPPLPGVRLRARLVFCFASLSLFLPFLEIASVRRAFVRSGSSCGSRSGAHHVVWPRILRPSLAATVAVLSLVNDS